MPLGRTLATGLFLLALTGSCLAVFSLHYAVLPYRFHADELGKGKQILANTRNFSHPLLLLNATQVVQRWWAPDLSSAVASPATLQQAVQLGRLVSASLAAGAVLCLAATAMILRGPRAMVAVGVVVALCPSLLMYAHDFKEDTALVFGLAAFALTLAIFDRYHGAWSAAMLGLGAALAVSGKYIGVMALPLAITMMLAAPWPVLGRPWLGFWTRLAAMLSAFVCAAALINHQVLHDPGQFVNSMMLEAQHGVTEHSGLTSDRPNWHWAWQLGREVSLPVLALAGLYLVCLAATRRRRSTAELLVAAIPLVYFVLLLWCPIPFNRYLLPATVFTFALAGLGVVELAEHLSRLAERRRGPKRQPHGRGHGTRAVTTRALAPWVAPTALLGVVALVQLPRCVDYLAQFPGESRLRFDRHVRAALPGGARIIADFYAGLAPGVIAPDATPQGPLTLVVTPGIFAADMGSLDTLRRLGVTHVAVCDLAYARYFDPRLYPGADDLPGYERRKAFYQSVFAQGQLVWDSKVGENHIPSGSYTNPHVMLYWIGK